MSALGRLGLATLLLLLVACAQAPGASPNPSPAATPTPTASLPVAGLDGRQFLSTGITWVGAPYVLVPDTRVHLSFNNGQLSANAGCNTIGGSYVLDGNVLRFSGASMTEMGCEPALMAQDQWLVAFLVANPAVVLTDSDLKLATSDTVMMLANSTTLDQPLVGPTWRLTAIISGDAVASLPVGVNAAIVFADDGTFQMHDGCNSGGGSYAVDGATIRFADVVMTKIACAGAAGQVEQAVLAVIGPRRAVTLAVDANSLTLTAGIAGLQYSTAPVAQ